MLVTDGEHQTPPRISNPEVPLGTAKNVRDGYLDLENTDYVSMETAVKCWKRCEPMHNDILMVCVGATTGRLCLLKKVKPEMFEKNLRDMLAPIRKEAQAKGLTQRDVEIEIRAHRAQKIPK